MFKTAEKILLVLIVLQTIVLIVFLPNLENPDVAYHFDTIFHGEGGQESIYKNIQHKVSNLIISVTGIIDYNTYLEANKEFGYFNWETLFIYDSYNSFNIMGLQFINLIFMLVAIFLYFLILKLDKNLEFKEKRMFLRLCLLYFLYPAVGYLIVGITPDLITYLYQPFFILFLYKKVNFRNLIVCLILFLYFDEGIILNIYFLFIYIFFEYIYRKRIIKSDLAYYIFGGISVLFIYFGIKILSNIFSNRIFEIMIYVQENHGVIYTKLINVFLGALYFGGSGNYITFPLFYGLFGGLIFFILLKVIFIRGDRINSLKPLLLANLIAVFSAILLIPSYSHIRYYLYTIIIILICLFTAILKDKFFEYNKNVLIIGIGFFIHNVLLALTIAAYTWN